MELLHKEKDWLTQHYNHQLVKITKRANKEIDLIIGFYRELIGCDCNDKTQDDLFYPRFIKSSEKLLESLHNNIDLCYLAMVETQKMQITRSLDWKLDTVVKLLPKWIGDRQKHERSLKMEEDRKEQEEKDKKERLSESTEEERAYARECIEKMVKKISESKRIPE